MFIHEPMTRLERQITRVLSSMERMHFEEYLRYVDDRRRQFMVNFTAGLARGLGAAVGFSILGAMILAILQRLVTENIPGIGGFLADIIRMVRDRI